MPAPTSKVAVGAAVGSAAAVVVVVPGGVTAAEAVGVIVVRVGAVVAGPAGLLTGAALVEDGPGGAGTATTPLPEGWASLPIEMVDTAGMDAPTLALRPPLSSNDACCRERSARIWTSWGRLLSAIRP